MSREKSKTRRKSKIFVWAFSIFLFVIAFALLISSIYLQRSEKAYLFGYRVHYILTGSMEPDIPEGSIVVVKRTDPEKIEVGDVISFISSDPAIAGSVNTHSVIEIDRDEKGLVFTTKGTANPIPDEYKVRPDDVVGVVKFHSLKLGNLYRVLSNRTVLFIITIVPLAVIVIYSLVELIVNIYKQYPDEKKSGNDGSDPPGEQS